MFAKIERIPEHLYLKVEDIKNYTTLVLDHGNGLRRDEIQKEIRMSTANKSGIYVYMIEDVVLYVGKATTLNDRILSHYDESVDDEFLTESRVKNLSNKFKNFFRKHKGDITVKWLEIEAEEHRLFFEKKLQIWCNPLFDKKD